MTKSYDVIGGQVVPSLEPMSAAEVLARKHEVERLLRETRDNPARAAERATLRLEDMALAARLGELREAQKVANTRRNFAGIGSPLHEALVARLDADTVATLEADALARFAERERVAAERKAKKKT